MVNICIYYYPDKVIAVGSSQCSKQIGQMLEYFSLFSSNSGGSGIGKFICLWSPSLYHHCINCRKNPNNSKLLNSTVLRKNFEKLKKKYIFYFCETINLRSVLDISAE